MAGTKKGKKKTKVAKPRRKQCAFKGCRKMRVEGSIGCQDHQEALSGPQDLPPDPAAAVVKLTEIDLLRFLNADTELNNHQLEIRNIAQEEQIEKSVYEQRKTVRIQRVNALKQSIKVRSQEQKVMLVELGKKYGFDPSTSSIDDKTGIVHVHQQE